MVNTNIYLYYNGNCEEAFMFYKKVFGGDFTYLGKFKDMPEIEGFEVKDNEKNNIMHVALPIGNTILMGRDVGGGWNDEYKFGNNFAVFVNTNNIEEAERVFNELSSDGVIKLPLNLTFWGDYFGKLTDKFGINWIISFNKNQ